MGFEPTDEWPEEGAGSFRQGASLLESAYRCRELSFRERFRIRRWLKRPKELVARFAVTSTKLFAERQDGARFVMERIFIDALEVHGPLLAIGTGGEDASLMFFAPNQGDPGCEAVLALAPQRPVAVHETSIQSLPWVLLVVLLPFMAAHYYAVDAVRRIRIIDWRFGVENQLVVGGYLLLLVVVGYWLAVFHSGRTFIDTRGVVFLGLRKVSVRKLLSENTLESEAESPIELPVSVRSSSWFEAILTLLVGFAVAVMLSIGVLSLVQGRQVDQVYDEPLTYALDALLCVVVFIFWKTPQRWEIHREKVVVRRLFRIVRTVSVAPEVVHKNVAIVYSVGRFQMVLQPRAHSEAPLFLDLHRVATKLHGATKAKADRKVARGLSLLWKIPVPQTSKKPKPTRRRRTQRRF